MPSDYNKIKQDTILYAKILKRARENNRRWYAKQKSDPILFDYMRKRWRRQKQANK